MRLSNSQIKQALRMGDLFTKSDGTTFKAFHEFEHVETDGNVTESEYLLCERGVLKQNDIVVIDGIRNKVMYIKDDRSGLVSAYISETGGTHGRYV
ncbi:hypothetical protein [Providencia sp. JUb39]|uniref:hypothetical protein n=1 Tax=Providencia sp. JUb39 TaxID=2724165 RepID=UPI00164E0C70|nr:hypothetical protein [Providencia sp. JUb39]MBC5790613.1 hypothetical protein [Providencia sp. JUb39]